MFTAAGASERTVVFDWQDNSFDRLCSVCSRGRGAAVSVASGEKNDQTSKTLLNRETPDASHDRQSAIPVRASTVSREVLWDLECECFLTFLI